MLTQRSEKSKPVGQVGHCLEGYIGVYSRVFVDSSRHCPYLLSTPILTNGCLLSCNWGLSLMHLAIVEKASSATILRPSSVILQLMTGKNWMLNTLSCFCVFFLFCFVFTSSGTSVRHVYTISQQSQWHWAPVVYSHDFLIDAPCIPIPLFSFSFLYFSSHASCDDHHNKLHGLKFLSWVWSWGTQFKTLGNRLAMRDEIGD